MTLEEKAGLCSGKDVWFTKAVERLGILSIRTSDGPHGLRTQEGETNSLSDELTQKAVCYPTASLTAASFDRELVGRMGRELGKEAQALGVNVLLGPGINMKRSPLCGRNFEYFSEDPFVAGELGAAFVEGVQSQGVGACVKHFFANSQEHRRMDVSSEMDERSMREIYLPAFETVVKEAKPWTIMASYNKIGGTYSTANKSYLTDLLRNEWGFEGLVVSDWGATHDRVAAVQAGCDLTMPAEDTDEEIVEAVKVGRLSEDDLDLCCSRVLELAYKAAEGQAAYRNQNVAQTAEEAFDYEGGGRLAREVAENSMVLLKNNGILPLDKGARVVFIGGFAKMPRYQGGGSSHINSIRVTSALEAAKKAGYEVSFAAGYLDEGLKEDDGLLQEAVNMAKESEAAVIFAGLPDQMESEGVDRRHMNLPIAHNRLIEAVCAANPNTIVVLHNGAPVEMPWVDRPAALLEAYLGGQEAGSAIVRILYGDVNPSGHLAETFPVKLSDNPSYLYYFGEGDKVEYREGIFTGYRYYTAKELKPMFPFGYGLSYTSFEYSELALDKVHMKDTDILSVSVTVKNSGENSGKALVQLYIAPPREEVIRPVRELKGFEKVALEAGESRTVVFSLSKRDFAHWAENQHDWRVEGGEYKIQICKDAESVVLEQMISVESTQTLRPIQYGMGMSMGDFAKTPAGHRFLDECIGYMIQGMAAAGLLPQEAMGALQMMGGGTINLAAVEMLAHRVGVDAGGASGIQILFGQSVSVLAGFLPKEKTDELKNLMDELGRE